MDPVYLDYNATTPTDPLAARELIPFLEESFGNPSSNHPYGRKARAAVELGRARVANLLGCAPAEIVFTGGGTESNNHALIGCAFANRDRGNHLISSAVEHPAVLEPLKWLERFGFTVTLVPVDGNGRVDPEAVRQAVTPATILISVMHANNEVGTLQPLAEIGAGARESGILFHTDAAQSVGKVPTPVDDLGVDLLTVAGHKLYAPKGIGALYIRSGVKIDRYLHGAPGTKGDGAPERRTSRTSRHWERRQSWPENGWWRRARGLWRFATVSTPCWRSAPGACCSTATRPSGSRTR
jgi:cysteine desulfurase